MGRRNPERRVHKGNSDARIDREVQLGKDSNGARHCKWLFFRDSNKRYPAGAVRELRRLRGDGRPPKIIKTSAPQSLTRILADFAERAMS
jgi:hypothetical protein